jgi:putative DNA primase/helicase
MSREITARCTDLYNAEQLVEMFGRDLRHVGAWSKWLVWDGKCWRLDDSGGVMRRAATTVRTLLGGAIAGAAIAKQLVAAAPKNEAAEAGKAAADELLEWCEESQSEYRMRAMVALAKTFSAVAITHDKLDSNPWLFNVENGTLDLERGVLRDHRRADLITKLAPVRYDAAAECPIWDAFLLRAMNQSTGLVAYLQRMVGYALTGSVREHSLGFFFGGGANGKSTFLSTIHAMLGDYATPASRGLLFRGKGERHATELATLHSKRFVTCSEIGAGQAFDEALVKDLTGGDPINCRRMREDEWSFLPTHKLFIAGNHKPMVRGDDEGIWRRMRLIPWTVCIPENERDKTLADKLRAELPGILGWAVRGAVAWQQMGLGEPPAVKSATADYRFESDAVGQFFDAQLTFEAQGRVARKELRETYEAWCEEQGAEPLGARRFAERLRARGVAECGVRNGARVENGWRGVRLATPEEHIVRLDALGAVGIVGTNNPVGGAANDTAPNADSETDDPASAGGGMSVGSRYLVGTNTPIIRVHARAPTQESMGNGAYNLPTYQHAEDGQELFADWVERELGRPTGTEES